MKKETCFLISAILFNVYFVIAQTTPSEYRIANKIHVEGEGGWDYLTSDDATGRLFVSHGTIVQVVDVAQQKVIGTIPDTKGVHGIALAHDLNKGFISNGKDSSVTVFDLKTLAFIEKINVTGLNPDAILYDSFTHRVFTFNGKSSNSTVIEAKTDKVIGTIALDGKPEFSVSNDKGKIYVNIEDKSKVDMINPSSMKVEQQWPIAPGEEPSGLAIDKENNLLFMVCDNRLMIIVDALNGHVVSNLPIGEGPDGVAFDPVLKRAYSSNGDGTLTVVQEVNPNTFKVIENVATQKGARTITVNTKTHHIFLPTAEFGVIPMASTVNPHPRPSIKPGTFVILEIESVKQ